MRLHKVMIHNVSKNCYLIKSKFTEHKPSITNSECLLTLLFLNTIFGGKINEPFYLDNSSNLIHDFFIIILAKKFSKIS